jgi:hypothetical protein
MQLGTVGERAANPDVAAGHDPAPAELGDTHRFIHICG